MGCCVSSGKANQDKNSDKNTTHVEEETVVKEVLSETTFLTTTTVEEDQVNEETKLKLVHDPSMTRPELLDPEEGSEVSEICSESVEEEVKKQRKSQRSPGKSRIRVTCNNNNYNNPARTNEQSPRKRNNNSGARYGSGIRDPGERSGRRSRSPAMNRSVMDPGRTVKKRNNQSPGRVRSDPRKNELDEKECRNYGYTTEELLENPLVSLECFIFL